MAPPGQPLEPPLGGVKDYDRENKTQNWPDIRCTRSDTTWLWLCQIESFMSDNEADHVADDDSGRYNIDHMRAAEGS